MIDDYAVEDRLLALEKFHAVLRRRWLRDRLRRALRFYGAAFAVTAFTLAGLLYAIGYF